MENIERYKFYEIEFLANTYLPLIIFIFFGFLLTHFIRFGNLKFWSSPKYSDSLKILNKQILNFKLFFFTLFCALSFLALKLSTDFLLDTTLRNFEFSENWYYDKPLIDLIEFSNTEKISLSKFSIDTCISKNQYKEILDKVFIKYEKKEPQYIQRFLTSIKGKYNRSMYFFEYSILLAVIITIILCYNIRIIRVKHTLRYIFVIIFLSIIAYTGIKRTQLNSFHYELRLRKIVEYCIFADDNIEAKNSGIADIQKKNIMKNNCE